MMTISNNSNTRLRRFRVHLILDLFISFEGSRTSAEYQKPNLSVYDNWIPKCPLFNQHIWHGEKLFRLIYFVSYMFAILKTNV